MVWLPDSEKSLRIWLLVLTEYTNVTDGRTDRHRLWRHRPRLCIASRGKIYDDDDDGDGFERGVKERRSVYVDGCRYDLKDTSKVVLQDTHFLCAMAPPGGGRNVVSPRFLRHFILIGITPFNDDTMTRIFGTLLSRYLHVSFSFSFSCSLSPPAAVGLWPTAICPATLVATRAILTLHASPDDRIQVKVKGCHTPEVV